MRSRVADAGVDLERLQRAVDDAARELEKAEPTERGYGALQMLLAVAEEAIDNARQTAALCAQRQADRDDLLRQRDAVADAQRSRNTPGWPGIPFEVADRLRHQTPGVAKRIAAHVAQREAIIAKVRSG